MTNVSGYVVKYDVPGLGGKVFKRGCFHFPNEDQTVPIVNALSLYRSGMEKIVGEAKLSDLEDGLFADCAITDDGFLKSDEVQKCTVRTVSIESYPIETSKITPDY